MLSQRRVHSGDAVSGDGDENEDNDDDDDVDDDDDDGGPSPKPIISRLSSMRRAYLGQSAFNSTVRHSY